MAKIGNAEYPETTLAECLRIAGTIDTEFSGVINRTGLAHVLGMSPTGGAFAARLGSMRMWGIVEGRSTIRLTSTATAAVASGVDRESNLGRLHQFATSVRLFNQLHQRLHRGNLDRTVLAATIQELTGATMDEVESRLPGIERVFTEARQYMDAPDLVEEDDIPVTTSGSASESEPAQAAGARSSAQASQTIILKFSGGEMSLDETADNIDLLIAALVTRKLRLTSSDAASSDIPVNARDATNTGHPSLTDNP